MQSHAELFSYRVILITGFLVFTSAVLYVVSKRVGLLKLQRKISAAIKSGSVGREVAGIAGEGLNRVRAHNAEIAEEFVNHVRAIDVDIPVQHLNDEL